MDFCKHLKKKKMYTSFKQSVLILFLFFKIPQAGQTLIFYCYTYIDIEWRQRLAVQNELRRTLCIGMGSGPIISFFLTVLIRCFFFFYIMYVISETMQIKEYIIFSLNLEFGHLTLNCQDVSFVLQFCFIIVSVDFISLSFQFFYQVLINQEKNNTNSVNL